MFSNLAKLASSIFFSKCSHFRVVVALAALDLSFASIFLIPLGIFADGNSEWLFSRQKYPLNIKETNL